MYKDVSVKHNTPSLCFLIQPLNTGDKSIKVRQEHNINIGMTSLTKRNITA